MFFYFPEYLKEIEEKLPNTEKQYKAIDEVIEVTVYLDTSNSVLSEEDAFEYAYRSYGVLSFDSEAQNINGSVEHKYYESYDESYSDASLFTKTIINGFNVLQYEAQGNGYYGIFATFVKNNQVLTIIISIDNDDLLGLGKAILNTVEYDESIIYKSNIDPSLRNKINMKIGDASYIRDGINVVINRGYFAYGIIENGVLSCPYEDYRDVLINFSVINNSSEMFTTKENISRCYVDGVLAEWASSVLFTIEGNSEISIDFWCTVPKDSKEVDFYLCNCWWHFNISELSDEVPTLHY